MTATNRFTEMFQNNKVHAPVKPSKKRGQINFGDALGGDQDIEALFKSLHDKPEDRNQQPVIQTNTLPPPSDSVDTTHDTTQHIPQQAHLDITDVTSRLTNRFVNRDVIQVTSHETTNHTALQPGLQTGINTDIQTDIDTTPQTSTALYKPLNTQTDIQTGLDTGMYAGVDPELWYPFSPHQGAVLLYLIECGGRSNKLHIVRDTGVPYGTVQRTVALLGKNGYITNIQRYYNHKQRGFTFSINQQQCAEFYNRLKSKSYIQPIIHTGIETDIQAGMKSKPQGNVQTGLYLSPQAPFSSSRVKETTTSIITGPEMIYWEDLGLQNRQAQKWCEQFNINPDDLRQQLAWARWDLVNNGKEAEVKDPLNWFYGVLRNTAGCYPPAKGYQSPVEIRAARLRAQIDAEARARDDLATLETEAQFQAVLGNPEGVEYLKLLSGLPDAMSGIKGRALESILRERFFAREG